MDKNQIALLAIKRRFVYDLELNKYVAVDKLTFWGDELVIGGFLVRYRVSDYGKTWKLSIVEGLDQRYIAEKCFDKWLSKTGKLNKKYKNGENKEEK